jgi:ABC-2 type transport system ATP-binding protein
MIQAENLTKRYGDTIGVTNLDFRVEKGEVLGFLGPNGAGKTTTMKMLTCYLPPTAGTAKVCGFDILDQSMEVRKRIGYLPERNPLYGDMTVRGYLDFVARVKGVRSSARRSEIDRAIERCGLEQVPRRTIGKLSKGYQQRVGIAQATLNDPEILILDEPTLGLDPKQIIEIRQLIRDLGGEKTVILSSHILPEVSQVCNRVIIINRGELVAADTPENLRSRLTTSSVVRVALRDTGDASARAEGIIRKIDGVIAVREKSRAHGTDAFAVECMPERDLREEIGRALVAAGLPLLELYQEELSLEEIFLQLVTEEAN